MYMVKIVNEDAGTKPVGDLTSFELKSGNEFFFLLLKYTFSYYFLMFAG